MLQIIVKGTEKEARKACAKRGIEIWSLVAVIQAYKNVIFLVDDQFELKVVHWFCSGNLLHYSYTPYKGGEL